jgi:hypothetical protein
VKRTIALARKFRAHYDEKLPKWYSHYPVISPAEEAPPPPPEETALSQFFAELPPELLHQLVLVMYVGRGDFDVEDLAGASAALKQTFGEPKWPASQMIEKAPLAAYLSDGLTQLQGHDIDVDNLPFRAGEVAKS